MKTRSRGRRRIGPLLTWAPLVAVLLLGVMLVGTPSTVARAGSRPGDSATSTRWAARALYERVLAPCCFTQTLDVHESELTTQLRHEIGDRLADGESAGAIEDDLARRFGERVRAVPRGRDPRQAAAWFAFAAMGLSLLALLFFARRWTAAAPTCDPEADLLVAITHEEDSHCERELERSLRRLDGDRPA